MSFPDMTVAHIPYVVQNPNELLEEQPSRGEYEAALAHNLSFVYMHEHLVKGHLLGYIAEGPFGKFGYIRYIHVAKDFPQRVWSKLLQAFCKAVDRHSEQLEYSRIILHGNLLNYLRPVLVDDFGFHNIHYTEWGLEMGRNRHDGRIPQQFSLWDQVRKPSIFGVQPFKRRSGPL